MYNPNSQPKPYNNPLNPDRFKGFIPCPKHPGTMYNPKKFKMCFHCYQEQKGKQEVNEYKADLQQDLREETIRESMLEGGEK